MFDKKNETPKLSAPELKLQQLLEEKKRLEIIIDNCPVCDGRSLGVCGQNHKEQWDKLLKEIDEAELDARG